jgi:hypothetical protein
VHQTEGVAELHSGRKVKEKIMPFINIILFLLPLIFKIILWLESANFIPTPNQRKALAALLNYTERYGKACDTRGIASLVNGEMVVALDDLHNLGA